MIAFNHVVPVLNLSVFNVRRAPAFAFEQSKRATIGGRFIRVDESRDLPLLHVVEDFTQKPVCSFAVTTGGEIKIDSAAPAVDGPVQIRPAAIDLHVGFIHVPRAKIGRVTPVPAQPFFHFRRITLNPAVNRGVIDIHSAFSQHLLQLTVTDAVFAVPAYGPQNDVTLKMPAFEWVHVQLHQQKGMISLSPPTICNSALRVTFALDCCDREALHWAVTTGGFNSETVQDVMLGAVERRFGNELPASPVEWLTDNGSCYRANETRQFARMLGLEPKNTAVRSPESNGIAESFVKTIKRDYISIMPKPDGLTAAKNLAEAFEHYNEWHPHSALGYRSPREYLRQRASNGLSDNRCLEI